MAIITLSAILCPADAYGFCPADIYGFSPADAYGEWLSHGWIGSHSIDLLSTLARLAQADYQA
jgi:hypothetical protein